MAKPGRLIQIAANLLSGSGVSYLGALRQPAIHDQFGRARHGFSPSGLPALRRGLVRARDRTSSARHPRRSSTLA